MTMNTIPSGTWNVDPSHTHVGFTTRHAGISKVRGQFEEFQAVAVKSDQGELSLRADITVSSINSNNAGRDAHLRGPEFFDTERFPMMTYVSQSVTFEENEFVMEGQLTIKGVTHPAQLTGELNGTARDPFGNLRLGVEATATLSRKDFGLTWNATMEAGGVLVSDKIKLELDGSFILDESNPS